AAGGQCVPRYAAARRAATRLAGDGHEPAHALRDLIDAPALAIRTGLTESGDRRVDEARIHRPEIVVGDLQSMLDLRAHVLDEHVGGLDDFDERRVSAGMLQVDRDPALVPVQVDEIEAIAPAAQAFLLARALN